ncbi:hypothetical protein O181_096988 [Austropuccinia psidii MF-1]|uniref:Uncharacterized protein n=1 Tax=Austropuccinia psidii MF-1 TaxID=1389203 RepID=A0A9Q3J6L2_9BASI|nr:hypothetical protein [Austropuccinia psidii MF-1]
MGPFWPKSNEAKRGQGGSSLAPNARWAHLSQFFPQNPTNSGPQIGHNSVHGLWQRPEATSSAPGKDSSQAQGNNFPSSMHPVLKDPGMVHIWYNIPLCTIFAQQSNGDIFGTKLGDFKSSPPSITNFELDSSATQTENYLVATRRPSQDPNHLALQELGCQLSSGLL